MKYYVYHKSDSRIASNPAKGKSWMKAEYKSEGAAKAAVTRMVRNANAKYAELMASKYSWDHEKAKEVIARTKDLAIAESGHYHQHIERYETTYSMYDTKRENPIRQSVNTPAYMDPACESYWSM